MDSAEDKKDGKIGIMTWWHNANYGGFLQGIALQNYLERQGYDAELLDFAYPRVDFRWWRLLGFSRVSRPRDLIAVPLTIICSVFVQGYATGRVRRLLKMRKEHRMHAKSSPMLYGSMKEISGSGRYRAMLAGSDQIWNSAWYAKEEKEDKIAPFLLDGLGDGIGKASYASSVGRASVGEDSDVFRRNLARFSAISVREKVNVKELEALSGKRVEWVADPTLLLDAKEWRDLLHMGNGNKSPHICLYWLSSFDGHWRTFLKISRECALPLHVYADLHSMRPWRGVTALARHVWMRLSFAFNRRVSVRIGASCTEFLEDLSTADLVLTDSFHALVLSFVFGRKVRVAVPKEKEDMKNRIVDFLELAQRKDILAEMDYLPHVASCRRAEITPAIADWIVRSKEFLKCAVG